MSVTAGEKPAEEMHMSTAVKLRRAPGRIAAGAFILNSGLNKLKADEQAAQGIHGMAVGAYPFLGRIDAKTFVRALSISELAVGGALLLPIVPAAVAGAGLAGLSGGLVGLYWRTPGMHADGDPRPTQQGTALAKDTWLAGIAASLLLDALLPDSRARRAEHRAQKAEQRAARAEAKIEQTKRRQRARADARRLARDKAHAAREAARSTARDAAHSAIAQTHSALDSAVSTAKKDAAPLVRTAAENIASASHKAVVTSSHSVKAAAASAREAVGDALP
jgi:hypothetical protein